MGAGDGLGVLATVHHMKAAVHTRYGPPEVVRISDVEKPTAKDNDLLVKVHATTVNRTDCGFRSGKPRTHLPRIARLVVPRTGRRSRR